MLRPDAREIHDVGYAGLDDPPRQGLPHLRLPRPQVDVVPGRDHAVHASHTIAGFRDEFFIGDVSDGRLGAVRHERSQALLAPADDTHGQAGGQQIFSDHSTRVSGRSDDGVHVWLLGIAR